MKILNVNRLLAFVFALGLVSCGDSIQNNQTSDADMNTTQLIPERKAFQDTIDGKATDLYVLTNGAMKAAITNYGGRLVSLIVPDSSGKLVDVVVGLGSAEAYVNSTEPYFGATIGRVGNRIAGGKFTLDGKQYGLFTNNGPNTLHGGKKGFQAVVWDASQLNDSTLQLKYKSVHMEEGFPGNLDVTVVYSLTKDNGLNISYEATTDQKTVVNLTNHAFFNLNGEGSGTVNGHLLQINAERYTPVDSTLIPTGELAPVAGTPFDFTKMTAIGARVDDQHIQIQNGKGYDHNFVLTDGSNSMKHAATVKGDKSGIVMKVYTTEPGIQFYGGNFMQAKNTFKSGAKDEFRTAFCLETQHFPDAPNQPSFPSIELNKGETYKTQTRYAFSQKIED